METDIVMNTQGALAVLIIFALLVLPAINGLAVLGWKYEKLEKQLAEANEQREAAKKEKEQHDLLCEGAFRLMTWLKERGQ